MKKIYVTWHDVQRQTQEILRQLQKDNWKPDYIVGITRGGLTLSNLLSQYLDVTMYTLDVRLRDGKHVPCETNTKLAEIAFGMNNGLSTGARWDVGQRKKVLIVDDEPWKLQSQAGKRTRDMITSLGIYLRDTKKSDNW